MGPRQLENFTKVGSRLRLVIQKRNQGRYAVTQRRNQAQVIFGNPPSRAKRAAQGILFNSSKNSNSKMILTRFV